MVKKIILFMCLLFISSCSSKSYAMPNDKQSDIEILMAENAHIIIDVRTKEEYDTVHIKGAINIPYDELNEDLNLDKNKMIFVYCQSGNRSAKAYTTLKDLGYEVYDLGGINEIDLPKEKSAN